MDVELLEGCLGGFGAFLGLDGLCALGRCVALFLRGRLFDFLPGRADRRPRLRVLVLVETTLKSLSYSWSG